MQGGNATLRRKEREAFPQKGEQTERADHPVDGSPERFCGPPSGLPAARTSPQKPGLWEQVPVADKIQKYVSEKEGFPVWREPSFFAAYFNVFCIDSVHCILY